jgi:hypothetical protein
MYKTFPIPLLFQFINIGTGFFGTSDKKALWIVGIFNYGDLSGD